MSDEKSTEVYSVGELIAKLQMYPRDAVAVIGICHKRSIFSFRGECHRDLVHVVDFVHDENDQPVTDQVLIHGAP